jgi:hypothetical protein
MVYHSLTNAYGTLSMHIYLIMCIVPGTQSKHLCLSHQFTLRIFPPDNILWKNVSNLERMYVRDKTSIFPKKLIYIIMSGGTWTYTLKITVSYSGIDIKNFQV